MNSDRIKEGVSRAPHRSLLKATGLTSGQIRKPIIGHRQLLQRDRAGHIHLQTIARAVKDGVLAAGGTPLEFNTIGICDGIAMGHEGMKYSLASRELIADTVECMVRAHCFDALVFIPNCDKIIPGMLMAAARLNLPSLFVSGGPMLSICDTQGAPMDLNSVFEAVGSYNVGKFNDEQLAYYEDNACPGCGSCAGMFTANSMNCLSEAVGIALPGNGSIPAVYAARTRLAKQAGEKIMELLEKNIRALDILNEKAFRNALTVDMRPGLLHEHHPAPGRHRARGRAHLQSPDDQRSSARGRPNLCKLAPAGKHHLQDLYAAGGVQAVMAELSKKGFLDTSVVTATGRTVGENLQNVRNLDTTVIRDIDGSLLPHRRYRHPLRLTCPPVGAVVKRSAVTPDMLVHQGPARVFDSEDEAQEAIFGGKIKPGDVVVIRYEGPAGGPGMREMLSPTSAIAGMGLDKSGGPRHGRPLLRRHTRRGHRPHLAGGPERRQHRLCHGGRYDLHQYSGIQARPAGLGRRSSKTARRR